MSFRLSDFCTDSRLTSDVEEELNKQVDFLAMSRALSILDALLLCESPIEQKLLLSLMEIPGLKVYFKADPPLPERFLEFDPSSSGSLIIFPQYKIEKFRLDFLAKLYVGERLNDSIGIECDGYEFHDRTKEQVMRDKETDRILSLSGISVFRFSGSEIYRNPKKCAEDIWGIFAHRARGITG